MPEILEQAEQAVNKGEFAQALAVLAQHLEAYPVTWINKDQTGVAHTVTSNVTGQFDSGVLTTSATWSHTFTAAGTYYYHCSPHPQMWGVIIVS